MGPAMNAYTSGVGVLERSISVRGWCSGDNGKAAEICIVLGVGTEQKRIVLKQDAIDKLNQI